jgi:transcriptional regulator with XRE-family HTH domain
MLRFTRPQMARRLGVTENAYWKNEKGLSLPGHRSMHVLSEELGISIDWLFFGKGEMHLKDSSLALPSPGQPEIPETALAQDVREMLETMAKFPELHHSIMLFFHKYKKENPALFP